MNDIIAAAVVVFIVALILYVAAASLAGRGPADEDGLCVRCGAVLGSGAKCRRCGHAVRDV